MRIASPIAHACWWKTACRINTTTPLLRGRCGGCLWFKPFGQARAGVSGAKRPALLVQALHCALLSPAKFYHETYPYWFLAQNMLAPAKPEFADLAWARITAARAEALA